MQERQHRLVNACADRQAGRNADGHAPEQVDGKVLRVRSRSSRG